MIHFVLRMSTDGFLISNSCPYAVNTVVPDPGYLYSSSDIPFRSITAFRYGEASNGLWPFMNDTIASWAFL